MFSQLQDEIMYTNDTTLDMTVKTLRISKKPQLQNGEKQSCSIDNQCVKDWYTGCDFSQDIIVYVMLDYIVSYYYLHNESNLLICLTVNIKF